VPVKPVAEAPKPAPMAGAQEATAAPQPAASGTPQAGWDAFGRGDYQTALAIWQPLAEKGDVAMQLLVGSIYDYGQGVPQDDAEAAKWYERAAEQGDEGASYIIASMYEHGDGVMQDVQRAFYWYAQAAALGDRTADIKAREMQKKLRPD
jgi:TPR repeat protein